MSSKQHSDSNKTITNKISAKPSEPSLNNNNSSSNSSSRDEARIVSSSSSSNNSLNSSPVVLTLDKTTISSPSTTIHQSSPSPSNNSSKSLSVLQQSTSRSNSSNSSSSSSNSSLGSGSGGGQSHHHHFSQLTNNYYNNSEGGMIEGSFMFSGTPSPRIADNDPVFANNLNIPMEDEERLSASSIGKRDLNELLSKSAPNLTSALSNVNNIAFVMSENNLSDYTFGDNNNNNEEEEVYGNSSMLLSIGKKVSSPAISKHTPNKKQLGVVDNHIVEIQPLHNTLSPNNNSKRRMSHQMDSTPPTTRLHLTPHHQETTSGSPVIGNSPLSDDKVIDEFLEGNTTNRGRKSRSKSTIVAPGTPTMKHVAESSMSPITPTRLAILRNSSVKHPLPSHLQSTKFSTPTTANTASPGGISVETSGSVGSPEAALSTSFHLDPQTKDSITQSLKRKYSRAGSRSKFSKSVVDDHRLSMSLETIGIVLEHRGSTNNLLSKTSMKGSDLLQAVLQLQQERKETPMPESNNSIAQKELEEVERKKAELRKELKTMDKMQCNQRLYLACKENDSLASSVILDEFSVDINWKNTQDMEKGFLHLCARENNTELMEMLLDHNADPNMKDKVSRTPIHVACSSGSHFCMVLLLGHDANPNVRDEYGFSPLGLALKQHHFDMAKDLLLFGADVNLKLWDGSTILHDVFGQGDMAAVKFLINDLPDSHSLLTMVRNDHGWSALFCAIQNSQIDVIRYLLTSKYQHQIFNSLSNSSNSGENVFHIVAKSGDVDMLSELIHIFNEREPQEHKMLLQQTMSNIPSYNKNMVSQRIQTLLNYQDNMRKMTPLHIAAKTKKAVMVRELMRLTTFSNTYGELVDKKKKLYRAVDINIQDKKGNTALHYCFTDIKDRDLTNSEKAMITFLTSSKTFKTDIKNEKGLSVKALCKKYGVNLKDYIV